MNVICPLCNQTLNAAGVPPGTKVNCSSCRNDFLTPEYAQVLPVAQYQATKATTTHTSVEPSNFFSKITTFHGRIGRLQYFYGLLFKWGLMFGVGLITIFLFSITNEIEGITMIISLPLCLLVIWVNLSLQARRLHDMGQSGFWLLLYLVPVVNVIFALVIYIACLASEGNKKANKYGLIPYRIFGSNSEIELDNSSTVQHSNISFIPPTLEKRSGRNMFGGFPGNYEECGINRFTYNLASAIILILSPILNIIFPFDGDINGILVYAIMGFTVIVGMRIYNIGLSGGLAGLVGIVFFLSAGVVASYLNLNMVMVIIAGIVVLCLLGVCAFQEDRRIPG